MGAGIPTLPLFVYGTLRPGQPAFTEMGLAGRVRVIGPDRLIGRLYDLGAYPGFVAGKTGEVHGDLIAPLDGAVLPLLDEFEDFWPDNPARSEYRRDRLITRSGVEAWVYVYARPTEGLRRIASGDWVFENGPGTD